ncbi:MAG: hypothetical protein NVSMB44_46360 [Ktedonobacteraceae bacterium]
MKSTDALRAGGAWEAGGRGKLVRTCARTKVLETAWTFRARWENEDVTCFSNANDELVSGRKRLSNVMGPFQS